MVTIVVASMAGYALARLRIRGTGAILAFILLAGFFPVLAMIGPLFLVLRYLGMLNNIYPLIIVYLVYTLPISTWLLKSFFEQIPAELEDAALVDGATRLQVLRKVVIPVAVPAVFTAAILSFILAWNDFAFAVSFLTSQAHFTAPLAITTFGQSQFQTFYNLHRRGGGDHLDPDRGARAVRAAPDRVRADRGLVPLTRGPAKDQSQ